MQVADDGVDLNDDVLGNLGLYGLSFYHLYEGNVLLVSLCGRDLAKHLEVACYNDTWNVTGYIVLPRGEFFQGYKVSQHDRRRK